MLHFYRYNTHMILLVVAATRTASPEETMMKDKGSLQGPPSPPSNPQTNHPTNHHTHAPLQSRHIVHPVAALRRPAQVLCLDEALHHTLYEAHLGGEVEVLRVLFWDCVGWWLGWGDASDDGGNPQSESLPTHTRVRTLHWRMASTMRSRCARVFLSFMTRTTMAWHLRVRSCFWVVFFVGGGIWLV